MIARAEAELRARPDEITAAGADVAPLTKALSGANAVMEPLFELNEERLRLEAAEETPTGLPTPDLSVFYRVEAEGDLEALAKKLLENEAVEAAYVVPPAEPARAEDEEEDESINEMAPAEEDAPSVTPDFTGRQGYLDAAPGGIDARFAWTVPGGEGAGVTIIDIEGAWRFSHEDLRHVQGGVVGGTQSTDIGWRNHGTAVIGVLSGDRNSYGITGICPMSMIKGYSIFTATGGQNSANAIRKAADALSPGDIILIELHRPGPAATGAGQFGYIAIEWWEQDFAAIQYARSKGVIVVEAAGNGSQNLDDPIYNRPLAGFPPSWRNPFNRANRDSGAVVVGAGAPPPGTHGRNHGPDRSRLGFSNWGAMVDAQGWGREVTTCGYGDLQNGTNEDLWYTDQFSGTSSASPIVVGALACLQGVAKARPRPLLTWSTARNILRTTGSPQQDAPGRPATQRIGNRPNLRAAIPRVVKPKEKEKEKNDAKDRKDLKEQAKDKELTKEKEHNKDKEKDKELGKEHKDFKDSKDRKDKDKDLKEEKDRKDQLKDKEKEKEKEKDKEKELQKDQKDRKDIKDRKDEEKSQAKDKELHKELTKEKDREFGGDPFAFGGAEPLEERMARLEATVAQLAAFIGPELRPDLIASALGDEPDLGYSDPSGASLKLGAAGQEAKQAKDEKDIEKLSDG